MAEPITKNKDIVVMYHGNCPDGFTAAWAAWKKFGDDVEYIPLHRYLEIPQIKNRIVYMLDYCPNNRADLDRLQAENKKLIVIDHHISEAESIKSVPEHVFDVNHSGAVLSWKYFCPDQPIPTLALYIEDRDLWNWKLSNTKEILNITDLHDLKATDFSVWDSIAVDLDNDLKKQEYIKKGSAIQQFREIVVQNIVDNQTQLVLFEGHEVYAANAPRYFVSEVGNALATKKPPFAVVWSSTAEKIVISMRASGDAFDVTTIAKKYGGGGHKAAGSYSIPIGTPLPWKVIKEDEK